MRRTGNPIRVTVQLIESYGAHLWSERYGSGMTDVFVLQDEIAAAIAGPLQVKPSAPPREYVPHLPAYEEFLMARICNGGLPSRRHAVGMPGKGSCVRSGFALAHSELGWCWYILAIEDQIPRRYSGSAELRIAMRRSI